MLYILRILLASYPKRTGNSEFKPRGKNVNRVIIPNGFVFRGSLSKFKLSYDFIRGW